MKVRMLVTGGARSGKSGFAESAVRDLGGESVLYVATAETPEEDGELRRRIEEHRQRRPSGWLTCEVSYSGNGPSLADVPDFAGGVEAVLLDSLTLWVSGRMFAGAGDAEILEELNGFLAAEMYAPVVVVTDEAGLGLVCLLYTSDAADE